MTAATRLVWALAGSPEVAAASVAKLLVDYEAACAMCGAIEPQTAQADKALGANFADRSHMRHGGDRICRACLWCCSGKPPATLRMWTVIAAPGETLPDSHPKAWLQDTPGLALINRANPAPLAATLAHPPAGEWLVSVAISAQKHVLPYAVTNRGDGTWTIRVEDHNITATPAQWAHVHRHAMALRKLGVPAEDVEAGTPRYITTPDALAMWREHNAELRPWLGSPILSLALWTITKGTMQ